VLISSDGNVRVSRDVQLYAQIYGDYLEEEIEKWCVTSYECDGSHIVISLKLSDITDELRPMKIRIVTPSGASMCGAHNPVSPLGKPDVSPQDYFWLIP
ncbi:MAG: hypothetical protein GX633_09610, partial [Clostridiales bacterium]|nr:hypothetical protein [Clostridiales bacterium]